MAGNKSMRVTGSKSRWELARRISTVTVIFYYISTVMCTISTKSVQCQLLYMLWIGAPSVESNQNLSSCVNPGACAQMFPKARVVRVNLGFTNLCSMGLM